MRVIPKKIHFIWYQGFDKIAPRFAERVQSVIDKNPEYEIYKWDNNSLRKAIKNIGQQYLDKYDSFEIMHQRIDYGRYLVLFWFGGISCDVDAEAYQGFDATPFINTSSIIVSKNSSNKIENLVKAGIPEVLMNATIMASPKNPIIEKLINHILGLSCDISLSKYDCLQRTTGPNAFTTYLLDNFKDKITILDNQYLDACNGQDKECVIPSTAILDQQQEGSWANPNYKKIARAWYFLKRRWMSVVIVLAIIIIFIILSGKK